MQITPPIARAIQTYVSRSGGAMRLVDALGVNDATAIRIGKGRAKAVRAATWRKLEPLLRPYLDAVPEPAAPPPDAIIAATAAEMQALTPDNRRRVYRFAVEARIGQDKSPDR